MDNREAAKARVRAKVAAEKALPASERIANMLHATHTHADAQDLLAAFRAEVLGVAADRFEAACPDDSDSEEVSIVCRCDSADLLRRMARESA